MSLLVMERTPETSLHRQTPLLESRPLTALMSAPVTVCLKLENVQPSGSFKIRGIGNFIQRKAAEDKYKAVVSSSGGNAGLAAAYAARVLGIAATVVVPSTTPEMMRQKLLAEGATVKVYGNMWDEADEKTRQLAVDKDVLYVHPFHHHLIWEGVSTLTAEVLQQCNTSLPSCIVLSVGGGGLLCGVLQGLIDRGLGKAVPVVAMETRGAHCLNAALEAGKPVSIGKITSVAKTLGALTVSSRVFELLPHCVLISRLVDDAQALQACLDFANDHRFLVEPSCGAALAAVYTGLLSQLFADNVLQATGPVVVVVCGGNAVTIDMLQDWKKLT